MERMPARTPSRLPLLLLLVPLLTTACAKEAERAGEKPKNAPVVPVVTARVAQKNMPLTLTAMGNAESCHTVAVKSRVDGQILKAHFTDGQEVRQGDPLFDLDDRPFQHRLTELKANLQRDTALLENARSRELRQEELKKQRLATEETIATLKSARQAAEATVAADRATIAEGELQLAFTRITAPIGGMAGRILIQPGNLIRANDANPLVVINQVDPMCLSFGVAEQHLPAIREHHARAPLTLQLFPNRESGQPIAATLLSLDNAVDRQTATVRLKARADNPDRRLWPGMFVTLTLKLAERPDALAIPTEAIQTGPAGRFVYVVQPDGTVASRPLVIAREDKDEAVIDSGLAAGEEVVTVGQWRIKPGTRVEIARKTDPERKEPERKE